MCKVFVGIHEGRYVARENQAYVVADIKMNLNEMSMALNPSGSDQSRVAGM
jgi:hypothetical protein